MIFGGVSLRDNRRLPGDCYYPPIKIMLNEQALGEGDGVQARNEPEPSFTEGKAAEVLVLDLYPNEHPENDQIKTER